MVETRSSRDGTLPDVLAARARAASDGRLVLDVTVGLLAACGFAFWHPVVWLIPFNAAIALAAFGALGIAEREIMERGADERSRLVPALRVLEWIAIVAGALTFAVTCFAILGMAVGTWIS